MADKNIEILLKGVRLSFAHLFEPQENENDDGSTSWSYNVASLVPKKLEDGSPNPLVKRLNDAVREAIAAQWPGQDKKIPQDRRCLRDGEPRDPDTGETYPLYEGYEGCVYVSAKRSVKSKDSPNPVQLLGPKKTAKDARGQPCFPRLKESDGLLYSGCYADVIVRVYGYDGSKAKGKNKHPDRVNASLEAVKFVRHGEAFGAKPIDADSAFDEEDDDGGYDGVSGGAASDVDDDIG